MVTRPKRKGTPGPPPKVLLGYQRVKRTWRADAPAARALSVIAVGGTLELAAHRAHVHPETLRTWVARGNEALAEHPNLPDRPPRTVTTELLAYMDFATAHHEAHAQPVIGALGTIVRVSSDRTASPEAQLRAADRLLARLPQASAYRPVPGLEISGPDGGPVPVSIREAARANLLEKAERLAANVQPSPPDPTDSTETDHDEPEPG